ncbi:toxin biosynthesis protein [Rutstroemia sp. NJR-2017a BBW]|nr:toxin biosynthesis protein [Rutstroemia sp. NJR-2017a BBW]
MAPFFKAIEHVIPGQHIREYPNGTKQRQEDVLQLSIKQYIPLNSPNPPPENSITIIGVHGNGFPKETYEPLWNDLYLNLQSRNVHIRSIWMADCSNQGASGVLNEHVQGDDPSWFDHSRDLLQMINHFRSEMPRPIVGVAHSMGCAQLINLSIIHPRLLSTLVLYEPIIINVRARNGEPNPASMSTRRRDLWDSREKAESYFRKAFHAWDPRVVELFLKYGLRATPTALYDETQKIPAGAVTLTTSKHQESWTYIQYNFEPKEAGLDRLLLPDWDKDLEIPMLYTRVECSITMRNLPYLRPSVLYVFGAKSPFSSTAAQDEKVALTGSGVGGSGGEAEGKVQKVVFPEAGHLLVFENVQESARASAEWIDRWFQQWLVDERFYKGYESKKSDKDMLRVSKAWVATTKSSNLTPRPSLIKEKL